MVEALNGIWAYDPEFRPGDTISNEFSKDMHNGQTTVTYLIVTDSGYFYHNYVEQVLENITKRQELWVQEIIFKNDREGNLIYYDYDTSLLYKEHPRTFGSTFDFRIENKLYEQLLIIRSDEYIDSLNILSWSKDVLRLADSRLNTVELRKLKQP